jgi:hypothetical protein
MKASRPILTVGLALVLVSYSGCQGEPVRQAAPTPPEAAPALQTPAPAPTPAVVEPPPPTTADLARQRMATTLASTTPGAERRTKLMEAARLALANGTTGRDVAVLIARQAVDESGAGAAEHLLYARCLFEVGQHVAAQRELDATEPLLNDAGEDAFKEFERLEAQLQAAFGGTADLASRLTRIAESATESKILKAKVERMPGGYRVQWVLSGPPRRLIGIWSDHEDLAPIAFRGTDKSVTGAWSAEFTWTSPEPPRGTIIVLTVDETSGAALVAPNLKGLPMKAASDSRDRANWAALIDALSTNPAPGGLVLRLPEDAAP